MRRRRSYAWYRLVGVTICFVGMVGVIVLLATFKPGKQDDQLDQPTSAPAGGPRRLPVAGAPGFYVVVNPDGTSYLERPDGVRQVLVDSLLARTPDPREVERRIRAKMEAADRPKAKRELGQVIVLDKGVVDVPKGAVVTFVGSDRAVVLDDDGVSSTVYHADGRVEKRDRKKPLPQPVAGALKKE